LVLEIVVIWSTTKSAISTENFLSIYSQAKSELDVKKRLESKRRRTRNTTGTGQRQRQTQKAIVLNSATQTHTQLKASINASPAARTQRERGREGGQRPARPRALADTAESEPLAAAHGAKPPKFPWKVSGKPAQRKRNGRGQATGHHRARLRSAAAARHGRKR
jgi:hypothetical protein